MRKFLVALAALALLAAACGSSATPSSPSSSTGGSPAATAADCVSQNGTALTTAGQLTVGTGNPAYPPWYTGGQTQGTQWKLTNPATGKGYESAVVYAVAGELGFSKDQVSWIPIPFDQTYAPGPKPYDFAIQQISYTDKRAQAVDFSESYYDANPALVALKGTPIATATTIAQLQGYRLAAPIGTTDYDFIKSTIQPSTPPGAYNSLADAIQALKAGQVDGIVVDLPDAYYITAVQLSDTGTIVGQFPPVSGASVEYFAMAFPKGDPLVACVNMALQALKSKGTLAALEKRWLSQVTGVPEIAG